MEDFTVGGRQAKFDWDLLDIAEVKRVLAANAPDDYERYEFVPAFSDTTVPALMQFFKKEACYLLEMVCDL